jgi:hypothetical protein
MEYEEMYEECLKVLRARHSDVRYYLVSLDMYVKATIKAQTLLDEILDTEVTVQHTNKASKTNEASSPKVRMWALFNEQAMKLGKDLGLNLHQGKAGRPAKKKKDFGAMKISKTA